MRSKCGDIYELRQADKLAAVSETPAYQDKVRIAHNEGVFREINERIKQGRWPGESDTTIAFRCECAALGCNELVNLAPAAYEHVRADPRHFLVVAGHEVDGAEVVVERHPTHIVVEKIGIAGAVAEQSDPRDE
jgi:hypothetical protein